MIPVNAGTGEFGMGNSFDTTFYYEGAGEYAGQGPHKNIRNIAPLSVYRVAMFVRKDSSIKDIKDLKGKRVSAGFNAQKTIGRIIEAHLANSGLTYDDVQKVLAPNVKTAADDFIAGKTDVLFFALGSAMVKQAAAAIGGLRVLPIEDSPQARERMEKVLPGSYVLTVKPSRNIEGIDRADQCGRVRHAVLHQQERAGQRRLCRDQGPARQQESAGRDVPSDGAVRSERDGKAAEGRAVPSRRG